MIRRLLYPLFILIAMGLWSLHENKVKENTSTLENPTIAIIDTPEKYSTSLKSALPPTGPPRIAGLFGRVLKGKTDKDFESLSNDVSRKIVFIMGPDGLVRLLGLNQKQILYEIGYTKDYIERLKQEGYRFKLLVFKNENSVDSDQTIQPATWERVLRLTTKAYPELAEKIQAQAQSLQSIPFTIIQTQAPHPFAGVEKQIEKQGPQHPDYIDETRLTQLPATLWQVRAFLFYKVHLTELFAGDGFTHKEDGTKGIAEYAILNQKVISLPNALLIDL